VDSPDDSVLSESANLIFQGFTYVAPSVLEDLFKPRVVKARSPRKHSGNGFRASTSACQQTPISPLRSDDIFDFSPPGRGDPMDTSSAAQLL